MASLTSVLAGMVALSGPASAKTFQNSGAPSLVHRDAHNLISLRADGAGVPDDSPIIRAADDAEVLKPIRPDSVATQGSKAASRKNSYGLRKENLLYWGGQSGTMAEFRVNTSGDKEGFVDMEYFDDLIESLDCPEDGGKLSVKFKDQSDFDAATDVWKWVTEDPDNSFLFMVGSGDCGSNTERLLYSVDDLELKDEENTAVLNAKSTNWKDAIHSFDLNIGKAADNSPNVRRDISPEFNVPFDFDLSGKGVSFSMNGVDYIGSCNNCTSVGSFDVEAKFSMEWFEIKEATVELSTAGIDTTAILDVTVKGQLTDELLEKSWPMFKASPAGIAIPGVVTIGPTVTVALKAGVNAIKGGVKLTLGGTAHIPPSTATLDFLNEDNTSSDGWEIESEAVPLEADVFVETRAYTSLTPSLGLEISAFGKPFLYSSIAVGKSTLTLVQRNRIRR